MAKIQVMAFQCERCEHIWVPRDISDPPQNCPKCKSPYWDRPRQSEQKPAKKRAKKQKLHVTG
jgi:predicted Zn-ribbon and HTH transcriptional regulator